MSASTSSNQSAPVAGESSTINNSPFDIGPSLVAATELIKTAFLQQTAVYAEAERARRDIALDEEFATKRSERQKELDGETETEERNRALAYLKPKLTKEIYKSVLSGLGVSEATSLVAEKSSHIAHQSGSSGDRVAGDDLSANKGEAQNSTLNGSLSEDISKGETTVKGPLNETSGADSGKSSQAGLEKPKKWDVDSASHDTTYKVDAADAGPSALDKPNAGASPRTSATKVATTIQNSIAAPATPDNATSSHGAADHNSSSPSEVSPTFSSPETPSTRASTIYNSSPLSRPSFTKAGTDTNTSPPLKKHDSQESEHKAGFAKFSSQVQTSGLGSQSGSEFGSSSSPYNTQIAGQQVPGFGPGQAFVPPAFPSFLSSTSAKRVSFGSGPDGGIIGGDSAQDAGFGKTEHSIAPRGTKRNVGDISSDDDSLNEHSHKRARTDAGSEPTVENRLTAKTKDKNSTGTNTSTRPTSNARKYDDFMAEPKFKPSLGLATTGSTAAASSEPPTPPNASFSTGTELPRSNLGVKPSFHGQRIFGHINTASDHGNTTHRQDVLDNTNTANASNNRNAASDPDETNSEVLSNSQDALDREDRSESQSITDVDDSSNPDSLDNEEEEEL